jgi:hypothetical protein
MPELITESRISCDGYSTVLVSVVFLGSSTRIVAASSRRF